MKNKRHDITEIWLKVALNTINPTNQRLTHCRNNPKSNIKIV